ncbi:unnamed protein product [Durusdinium trenchii]|uniref:PNPLA domain-containing protein n=1 Tax=Durusdinium trenchii TaxID=1381693 RepID=A0ABP0P8Q8_9DINO
MDAMSRSVSILKPGGERFELTFAEGDTVTTLKMKLQSLCQIEGTAPTPCTFQFVFSSYCSASDGLFSHIGHPGWAMRLIHGTEVLRGDQILVDSGIADGDSLTLVISTAPCGYYSYVNRSGDEGAPAGYNTFVSLSAKFDTNGQCYISMVEDEITSATSGDEDDPYDEYSSQEKWSQSYTCELCMEDRQLRLSVLSCTRRGVFIDSVETAPEVLLGEILEDGSLDLRQKLLPKIISGTSGGAAIAAYICCRTDDELLGDCKGATWGHCQTSTMPIFQVQPSITLWAGSWLERVRHYIKFGCVFPREPIERWAETWALGETTFLEAFKRTGRVLNITCSIVAGDSGEQVPLLLNYQTHSHVLIASAVICSGSMPGLLNPSKLLEKCPESGLIRAHCERQTCYADGSIDFDIPSLTLAQAFGVRYTVAVQVNPHVTPFNFAPHGEAGRPISWSSPSGRGRWRGGFILCALEVVLKESFRSAWKVMGLLQLLPRYFGCKWDLFFAQVYEGSVTLSTEDGYFWKCFNALENPSQEAFRYWWRQGRLMVWQKMPLLEAWSKAAAAAVDEDPGDPHRSQFDIKRTYANAIICDICDG